MLRVAATVQMDGLTRLNRTLNQRLAREVERTARNIQADAMARAPVKTGTLRRSIRAERLQRADGLAWLVVAGVAYAQYVEFGTRHMAARPYLTPAAERHRATFLAAVQAVLDG